MLKTVMPNYQDICEFFYKLKNNLLEDEIDQDGLQGSQNDFTEDFNHQDNIQEGQQTDQYYSDYRESEFKYQDDKDGHFDPIGEYIMDPQEYSAQKI